MHEPPDFSRRRTRSRTKLAHAVARATLVAAVACAFPAVFPSVAHAEASAADKETARRLMAEARDKRTANDLKGALASFQAADALMKVPTTGMEVARTQVSMSLLVEARDTALRVARSQPEGDEPPPFTRAREEARQLSEDLVKKIPTITVTVAGVDPGAAAQVSVDGANVPVASLGMPRTVNPGHHTIAGVAGTKQAKVELEIGEAQHQDVKLELVASAAPVVVKPPPPPPPETSSGGIGKPLFIGGVVVTGAGVLLGGITGVMSLSKTSTVKDNCKGNTCPASQQSNIDSASSLATISTIGFVVAGAGAAAAVVGLILWSGEGKAEAHSGAASFSPWIGPGSAGLRGSF